MKLIIDIPDETYTAIKNMTRIISGGRGSARKIEYDAFDAIYNGKPLPLIEDVDNCDSQYAINVKNQWNTVFKEEGAE